MRVSQWLGQQYYRFFTIYPYKYSPEIFTRKYPQLFVKLKFLAAGLTYFSFTLFILNSAIMITHISWNTDELSFLATFLLEIAGCLSLGGYFLSDSFIKDIRHSHQSTYQRTTFKVRIFRWFPCVMCCVVFFLYAIAYFHTRQITFHIYLFTIREISMLIISTIIMILCVNMMQSYKLTQDSIKCDYEARLQAYISKHPVEVNCAYQHIPGVFLVSETEIANNSYKPSVLYPYIGSMTIYQADLGGIKIQFLLNKISSQILYWKLFLQTFTVVGGFITGKLITFEYLAIIEPHTQKLWKNILCVLFMGMYILVLVFISGRIIENKSKAIKQLEDYQKSLDLYDNNEDYEYRGKNITLARKYVPQFLRRKLF